MATIQNPYYVSGSGRSYGDGIASIAQALLSGPTPDQIAANESDMRYRDALGGKALAETDLLTDKRKALGSLGSVVQQLMSGDPSALAGLTQALGQGDGLGELGNTVRAIVANMPGATDGQIGKAMAGAGTPLADNEALTPEAQAEKLRLAEEAAFGRTKYTADSSASASRYGSDRDYAARTDAARIGEEGATGRQRLVLEAKAREPNILDPGQTILYNDAPAFGGAGTRQNYTARDLGAEGALARVREQGFIDARKPIVLDGGQTAIFNDAPAFGGAGTRQPVTARDLGAEGTLAAELAKIDAEVRKPIALSADQSLFTPTGQKLGTAPGELKAAIGEVALGADGRRLEGPADPNSPANKPFEISPDDAAKIGMEIDLLAERVGGKDVKLDAATQARVTERASQIFQQTRNAGTATMQAWREIMGNAPTTEGGGWFEGAARVIPGTTAAETANYDGAAEVLTAPPPMEARKPGMIVQTPKGPMMWTGTGWKPAT